MNGALRPIVGAMRFSTISSRDKGAFVSSRERSWEDHVAAILSPERLRFRLRFLTEVTLPQIAAQTIVPHQDWFRLSITTSNLLPPEMLAVLHDEEAKYPWLRIAERGVDDWVGLPALCKTALTEMPFTGTYEPVLTFRLDDDDTIPTNYIERAQPRITPDNIDKILTFSNGAKVLWSPDDFTIQNYEEISRPFIAIGLGAITAFDFDKKDFVSNMQTVFVGFNHYDIRERLAFIEDDTPGMFIWSHHPSQDTFGRFKSTEFAGEWEAPPPDISEKLRGYPALANFVG